MNNKNASKVSMRIWQSIYKHHWEPSRNTWMAKRRSRDPSTKNRRNKKPKKLQTYHIPPNHVQGTHIDPSRQNIHIFKRTSAPSIWTVRIDVREKVMVAKTNSWLTKWYLKTIGPEKKPIYSLDWIQEGFWQCATFLDHEVHGNL